MTMTKSRRATGGRRKAAQSPAAVTRAIAQAGSFAGVLEALGYADVEDTIRRDRKDLSRTFQGYCHDQSGEKGDRTVVYTQKMHWSLLDVIALQETKLMAAMHAIFVLAEAVTGMEKHSRHYAKSLDRRFSLEDLEVEQIDDRNIKIALVRGEDEAAFTLKFPVVIDRGVWNERALYERGDGVTHAGSWWIAKEDSPGKPGDDTWRLAVKQGRLGKAARP